MKVWIVTTHWHYDCTDVQSVHLTEEGAQQALAVTEELIPTTATSSHQHQINEHEVQS